MSGPAESNRHFHVTAGGCLQGELRPASDKSISHRAVILGAIAEGTTTARNLLLGEDVLATISAFRSLGVDIQLSGDTARIEGVGLGGLSAPDQDLDMGNSGTAMRLLAGLLCAQSFSSRLTGDDSLRQRPMGRILRPLVAMGAKIHGEEGDRPPLTIQPVDQLQDLDHRSEIASAQVKSCILLAGLASRRPVRVREPATSRDHSERMLQAFGASIEVGEEGVILNPTPALQGQPIDVPSDPSAAAFFLVGASIAEGSDLLLRDVGINPTRAGLIDILHRMGASIEIQDQRTVSGEPVADLRVRSARLKGIDVPESLVPSAIDEFPALFVAAACAEGRTRIRGAAELRVKESDRIAAMSRALSQLGIEVVEFPDGADIMGGALTGGVVDSAGDHRVAMSLAMAALRSQDDLTIGDTRNVMTSYPEFVSDARSLGLGLEEGP